MIIAIDGPSGAGKGTLAKNLAQALNYPYLDTGLLFRALACKMIEEKKDLADLFQLVQEASSLRQRDLEHPQLRAHPTAEKASQIAVYPPVRQALQEWMRTFARQGEISHGGAILDGRDIGTKVCPDAELKLFITASSEERAKRRFLELQSAGFKGTFEEVLTDIERRDHRDLNRCVDPLRPAKDAVVLDTTSLSRDDVLKIALNYILKS